MFPNRFFSIRTVTVVCAVIFFGTAVGVFETYRTRQTTGPIQVLASSDQMFVFLEVRRIVHYPGWLRSPNIYCHSHEQFYFVVSETGIEKQTQISRENGVTFHPNLSHIFSHKRQLHLFQSRSKNYLPSVYRWAEDEFVLLPQQQGGEILNARGLKNSNPLEELQHLYHDRGWAFGKPHIFEWNHQVFEIVEDEQPDETLVKLVCQQADQSWSKTLVRYDNRKTNISGNKLRELKKRPRQNGHRK